MNKKNKHLVSRVTSKIPFYIFFGIVYLGFIWILHLYVPLYKKSNDLWNDRIFSQPLEGELFPENIILIDIDSWPYYKDNRPEAQTARDKVVKEMIAIIDLIKDKVPFIGIDMTFESFANDSLMAKLFNRFKDHENIFLAVEYDREKKALKFPANYFWDKIARNIEKIKKRLMVISLEKYKDEPIRRYKTFYKAGFDNTGAAYDFPSMGTVIAKLVNRYYLGNTSELKIDDRVSRFRFRYLIKNIKEDYMKYNVLSLQKAKECFFASGGQGALLKNRPLDPHKTFYSPSDKRNLNFSKSIVIFGRMDPDPDGRDRFPVCAVIKEDGKDTRATLPGVMIHLNAAMSILLKENIKRMGKGKVLVYLFVLLVVLILFHIVFEGLFSKSKSKWSQWYPEIFLFCAIVPVIILLDYLIKEPGSGNLEIPMFAFYMFALKFYPAIGIIDWLYRHFLLRWCKQKWSKSKRRS